MSINPASAQSVGTGVEVEYNNNPNAFEAVAQAVGSYMGGKVTKQKTDQAQLAAALPTLLSEGLAGPTAQGQKSDFNIGSMGFSVGGGTGGALDMGMTRRGLKNQKAYYDLISSKKKTEKDPVDDLAAKLFPSYQKSLEYMQIEKENPGTGDAWAVRQSQKAATALTAGSRQYGSQGRTDDAAANQGVLEQKIIPSTQMVQYKKVATDTLKNLISRGTDKASALAEVIQMLRDLKISSEDINKITEGITG